MTTFDATWINGQILPDLPVRLPDGTKLKVVLEPESLPGIPDEDWPTDESGIAQLLARMDLIEPLLMSAEEESEWQNARKAQRQAEAATSDQRAEELRRMWE